MPIALHTNNNSGNTKCHFSQHQRNLQLISFVASANEVVFVVVYVLSKWKRSVRSQSVCMHVNISEISPSLQHVKWSHTTAAVVATLHFMALATYCCQPKEKTTAKTKKHKQRPRYFEFRRLKMVNGNNEKSIRATKWIASWKEESADLAAARQ